MSGQLWRIREFIVLSLCVVISIVLLVMGESDRVGSARAMRAVVFYPLEKGLQLRERYAGLEDENRDLRLRVAALVMETTHLKDLKAENERLRQMLGFKEQGRHKMVPAEVIGWDQSSVGLNLEIDQGARLGIEPGHAVVAVDGLVGKVIEVYPQAAWVTTLLSPECAVSALDQRSRVRGIVRWVYPDGILFQLVAAGADVVEGDMIISSGLGGLFPKGLRIGTVVRARERVGDLFRTISLEPVVDFDRLEEVAVLTGRVEHDARVPTDPDAPHDTAREEQ